MAATPFGDRDEPAVPPALPSTPLGEGLEVEVELAAFLPEGVELAAGAEAPEPVAAAAREVEEGQGLDGAALDQLERDLDAVDAAIERLDAGTYGIDAASGAPIDDALLAADPTRVA